MDTQLKAEGEGHQADEEDQYSEETTHVRGRLRRLHGLRRRGRHRELRGGRHVSTPLKLSRPAGTGYWIPSFDDSPTIYYQAGAEWNTDTIYYQSPCCRASSACHAGKSGCGAHRVPSPPYHVGRFQCSLPPGEVQGLRHAAAKKSATSGEPGQHETYNNPGWHMPTPLGYMEGIQWLCQDPRVLELWL